MELRRSWGDRNVDHLRGTCKRMELGRPIDPVQSGRECRWVDGLAVEDDDVVRGRPRGNLQTANGRLRVPKEVVHFRGLTPAVEQFGDIWIRWRNDCCLDAVRGGLILLYKSIFHACRLDDLFPTQMRRIHRAIANS